MNSLIAAADWKIAELQDALAAETEAVAAAVAARQIGNGTGYWKGKHALERRLGAAIALRLALAEASE